MQGRTTVRPYLWFIHLRHIVGRVIASIQICDFLHLAPIAFVAFLRWRASPANAEKRVSAAHCAAETRFMKMVQDLRLLKEVADLI